MVKHLFESYVICALILFNFEIRPFFKNNNFIIKELFERSTLISAAKLTNKLMELQNQREFLIDFLIIFVGHPF